MNITPVITFFSSAVWITTCLPFNVVAAPTPKAPTEVSVQTVVVWQVAGVTTTEVMGRIEKSAFGTTVAGIAAANLWCQEEVAPNARFSTAQEWLESPYDTSNLSSNNAWVRPGPITLLHHVNSTPQPVWAAFDPTSTSISGWRTVASTAAKELSCTSFRTTASTRSGIYGNSNKIIRVTTCDSGPRPIACSTPRNIVVNP